MTGFDPYHKWLGISLAEQPPHHYRLLGITLFEQDADVVSAAADRQMAFIRQHGSGPHARESHRILNELAEARLCLLSPAKREKYDRQLQAALTDAAAKNSPATVETGSDWTPETTESKRVSRVAHPDQKRNAFGPLVGAGIAAVAVIVGAVAYIAMSPAKAPQPDSITQQPSPPAVTEPESKPEITTEAVPPVTPTPVVRAQPPAQPGGTIDLLADVDPQRDASQGQWVLAGGVLSVQSSRSGDLIQFPARVPNQYALELDVNPSEAAAGIMVGLKVGGALPYVLIDGGNGKVAGLARIGGLSAGGGEAGRSDRSFLTAGRWSHLSCQVQPGGIIVLCDGQPVIAWRGEYSRLSTSPELSLKSGDGIFLATEGEPTQFRNVVLRPLTESERVAPFPTVQLAHTAPPAKPAPATRAVASEPPQPQPTQPPSAVVNSPEPTSANSDKPAPPGAEELQRARKEIRTVLKDEFSKGKSNDDKISLALVLLDHAKKTLNDPVSKYALLDEAREAAASAGQSELVLKAIDELEADFDIDAFGMKTESLVEASKHLKDADDRQSFVEVTLREADDAVDADDFEHALKLASTAQSVATRARDPDLKKRTASRVTELKKLQKEWESLAEARKKLKASPDDPGANTQVGRYLCLLRGDWEHGLPLLAQGEDKKFAGLAERESADPVEAEEQIRLADDWWTAAQGEAPTVKDRVQAHAAEWYSRALPKLDGVSKIRVEKRLASLEGKDRPKKSKKQAQQPPAMAANPVMPAGPNNRPIDYDFERKFAQRLIDKRANSVDLRGERGSAGGAIRTLPEWPFYVDGFMALSRNSSVDDNDLLDVQRLHGLRSVWIDTDKVTDASLIRIARNGTLRSLRLGANSQISLKALRSCTDLETLGVEGKWDMPAIVALSASFPRLQSLKSESAASETLDLAGLSRIPNLRELEIKCRTVDKAMMAEIAKCRALTSLTIVDAQLASSQLPNLSWLRIPGCQFDANFCKQLQSLTELKQLYLERTSVTDDDLQYLPGSLITLWLFDTKITGEGFRKHRTGFPQLGSLNLAHSPLTDAGLDAALKLTPAVSILEIWDTTISPAGLRLAAQRNSLAYVNMRNCPDGDALLKVVSGLPKLRSVNGTFSPEAIAKFKQTHPDCNVTK